MNRKALFLFLLLVGTISPLAAQNDSLVLNLQQTVQLANDSSLMAFRAKNLYLVNYWQYRTFKAERLPSLTLSTTPLSYNRDFARRYDSQQNIDIYRKQQSLFSGAGLAIEQNLDIIGGTFFIDSRIGYLKNFGDIQSQQFSSTPIRVGYRQNLLGYNRFKWEKKINPLKYERAKKQFLTAFEETAERATQYFFDLAMAQAEYKLAEEKMQKSAMLYTMGEERFAIASIDKAALLTLKLDMVNSKNSFLNAESRLKRSMSALASFLNIDKNHKIIIQLPDYPKNVLVSLDDAIAYAKANNPKFIEQQEKILSSEQELDKARIAALFDASLNASIGFNQVAESFEKVYRDPSQQNIASITLSVPLVDWGVRKGRRNVAKSNLSVAKLSAKQEEIRLEEDLSITVNDFAMRQAMILSAEEALELAKMAEEQTRERFIIGKADVNSLTLSNNRRQEAEQNYITALRNYWLSYYKIRRLTLYDFEKQIAISTFFESISSQSY